MSNISAMAKLQYMSNYIPMIENASKPPSSIFEGSNSLSSFMDLIGTLKQPYQVNVAEASSETTKSYDLKVKADGLKSSLDSLTTMGSKSSFNSISAISSNSDALSVTASSFANTDSVFNVGVSQLAQSQQNTGTALDSGASSLEAGDYVFGITQGDKTTNISFNVTEEDTNETVQKKIASAINSSKSGVTAAVETKDGKSSLVLTGANTGEKSSFTVSDPYAKGMSSVSALGLNNVTRGAQDAEYSVNGVNKSSSTNEVSLSYAVSATLKEVTTEPVKVTFEKDTSTSVKAVKNLVSGINSLMSSGNSQLQNQLSGILNGSSRSLSSLGITRNTDGSLAVNASKLESAASSGKLENFFKDSDNRGFSQTLTQLSRSVSRSPMVYAYENNYSMMNSMMNLSGLFDAVS